MISMSFSQPRFAECDHAKRRKISSLTAGWAGLVTQPPNHAGLFTSSRRQYRLIANTTAAQGPADAPSWAENSFKRSIGCKIPRFWDTDAFRTLCKFSIIKEFQGPLLFSSTFTVFKHFLGAPKVKLYFHDSSRPGGKFKHFSRPVRTLGSHVNGNEKKTRKDLKIKNFAKKKQDAHGPRRSAWHSAR